jgi:glycosyltransferase involved in cell wall biosynthesis
VKPIRTLYLCYFGLRQPLVQTQVLPYLRQLHAGGIEVSLLTFEPDPRRTWSRASIQEWHDRLRSEQIRWFSLPYHQRPSLLATGYDIAAGARVVERLVRKYQFDVLHARAHVAAAMAVPVKRRLGCRLIFDIRGMVADEYADAGHWSRGGLAYRITKRAERALLRAADAYVVLTDQGRQLLEPLLQRERAVGRPLEVIPCCVDLSRFPAPLAATRAEVRAAFGIQDRRVVLHLGALGGWHLTEEMARFVTAARKRDPAAFALFITQSDPALIQRELRRQGVEETSYRVMRAETDEVPRFLAASDMALSFRRPSYAALFASPTKIAEYLASGLPVVSTSDVGDVDALFRSRQVGVLVSRFTEEEYVRAYTRAISLTSDPDIAERCRLTARDEFSLETVGGPRYRRLYDRLMRN